MLIKDFFCQIFFYPNSPQSWTYEESEFTQQSDNEEDETHCCHCNQVPGNQVPFKWIKHLIILACRNKNDNHYIIVNKQYLIKTTPL